MTWQEELGQLDRKLAAGQISADDYRRQRDRILAAASGGQQAAAPGEPQTPAPGVEQPQQGQNPAPFAPPFRWEAVPPNEPTQAVSHGAAAESAQSGDAADKTQIVSSDATADRTQVVPRAAGAGNTADSPAERTQHIPAIGAHQQQPPMQQPNQPTWPPAPGPAPAQDPSNPWGNPDEPLSLWAPGFHQGPEVFETTPNKKSKKLPIIIAAVVVVALAAAAVLYFTVFKKGSDQAGPTPPPTSTSAPPTTTEPPQPKAFGPLAIPVGHTGVGKVYTPAQLESIKPLPTPDLVLLKQHGVSRAQSVVGNMDSSTVSLWSFRSKNAKDLLSAIVEDQQRFGFQEVPEAKQGSVEVYKSKQKTATGSTIVAYRAHYISGGDVIRVESYDTDDDTAKANFTAALTAQVQHNPPA
ncbi:hypothetical protein [Labedaea rhizosphaerae]|uniref:Uncharacterized protein n=1 Tax=Labedaea rhizosphaerae TaxID=598644 RepID=A0A4R6SKX1_LABRH|nr:hypothetical protein [Labedaea rhizosphaerae]TDQ05096.1 hypothetical protein EV186_1011061 [Labedaea rhizosphaerae]